MASSNNTQVGAIRVEASLDGGKFVDGAKKIRKESKATEAQVKQSFSAMGAAVKGFGGALTAGLSIGLLGGLAKKALDFATSIKDVAAQAGVSTRALQEFRYAASQMGIKQAEADKGLTKLNETLSKAAAGSSSAQKALAAVGVTMVDVKNKTPTEIFGKIADQMIKQGGAAKNAAAANAVFGESAAKLNPLLDKGSQGINELAQAAQRLGIVLSDQQIQNADETARKLDDVRQVLAAQIAGVVADNASSIVSLAQALGQLTGQIVNFLGSNPQAALAILGGLAGSRFGLPGAAAGAISGAYLGSDMQAQADQRRLQGNTGLLRHNFISSVDRARSLRQSGNTAEAKKEFARAKRLRDRFLAAGGSIPGFNQGGGIGDIPQFLAGSAGGGRKSRTPRAPRDRSDDVTFQFDQELRRAQVDVLRAQQSLATTSDARAAIALQLLDAERQMQQAELDNRVRRAERDFAEGKITAGALEQVKAQAQKLQAEYDSADALQRQAIAQDLAAEKARDAAALAESGADIEIEKAQLEASLAETASERRAAELRILDLLKAQEKAKLEALVADQQAAPLARAQAQQRLDQLNSIYAGRAASVMQGTRGPMEDWLASLPTTAAKAQEAFEQLQVQGFEGLIDAALALTDGFDDAKTALLSTLKQFVTGLLKVQLQQGLGSIVGGGFKLPGFANGGSFTVGGIPGIDRNVLSINGVPRARVSNMERISVSNDNSRPSPVAISRDVTVHVHGVTDVGSFNRNRAQIARQTKRGLGI